MNTLPHHAKQETLRVLMLATYFPKPMNPLMGNWALAQAQAFRRQGIDVEVVSFTSFVPRILARTNGARAYALCPAEENWDGLHVYYPRWPVYPLGVFRYCSDRNPEPFMRLGWWSAQNALQRHVLRFQPDVIYAHHSAVNGYLAARLQQSTRLPFVVTDHDFGEIATCAFWPARKRVFQSVVQHSAAMVCVARRMEDELQSLFPEARTRTIPNGTITIPAQLDVQPRPAQLANRVLLFSCGHFYERKAFPLLVEAFAPVAKKHPEAILQIAGDGVTRAQVLDVIANHKLERQVVLLGKQDHQSVLQNMVWADLFVLVGWDEPFATVFSEAASAGKPIICANDGGFNDVLENGVHGLSVPPHDTGAATAAMERLVSDAALRRRMGAAARVLFETRLTWDHNAQQMRRIFEDAVAANRAAHQ